MFWSFKDEKENDNLNGLIRRSGGNKTQEPVKFDLERIKAKLHLDNFINSMEYLQLRAILGKEVDFTAPLNQEEAKESIKTYIAGIQQMGKVVSLPAAKIMVH